MLWAAQEKKVGVDDVQRFNPFHGSVIFSVRCHSPKTVSFLSPAVRTQVLTAEDKMELKVMRRGY